MFIAIYPGAWVAGLWLPPLLNAPGVEMILGLAADEQFGPMVVMGIGGVHAELLRDFVTVAPPFDAATAFRCLDRLKMRKLLDGMRGAPAVDVPAFCEAAAVLSVMALELADLLTEVSINPIKVLEQGCVGLDALIIGQDKQPVSRNDPGECGNRGCTHVMVIYYCLKLV